MLTFFKNLNHLNPGMELEKLRRLDHEEFKKMLFLKDVRSYCPCVLQHGRKSEDNLYLNVFSPAWDPGNSTRFAVLVFIHGGGFISDSCVKYGDERICEHLCTKDVVVVTTQYRLGYLGFFSTGDEHCPGNFALWDQTLALKWVQENIAFFNGDPRNVTVMGQSAGGASVDLLSICPHSRDLFQRVIPMAGNASCEWSTHNNMVEVCRKFAESIGISETHHSLNVKSYFSAFFVNHYTLMKKWQHSMQMHSMQVF
ncbi:Carboxylesterase [Necator americanus]|uniref:Carboxylesterase n=1 Tax=Necator americanus TaxID=51031 RepID=W2TNH5_NECAM|nr:Carboxylesterase [Necator americanus]ETN83655.1 Carboxylesterase [Necator americanus]